MIDGIPNRPLNFYQKNIIARNSQISTNMQVDLLAPKILCIHPSLSWKPMVKQHLFPISFLRNLGSTSPGDRSADSESRPLMSEISICSEKEPVTNIRTLSGWNMMNIHELDWHMITYPDLRLRSFSVFVPWLYLEKWLLAFFFPFRVRISILQNHVESNPWIWDRMSMSTIVHRDGRTAQGRTALQVWFIGSVLLIIRPKRWRFCSLASSWHLFHIPDAPCIED